MGKYLQHMPIKVTIIAPAGAIDPALVDGAAERLSSWGMEVTIAPHARGAYGRFAATDEERLADLQQALRSDADFLLCARGGYGVARIIDKIALPSAKTPVVIGFSDITGLHCLMGKHHLPSIHGSMCKALCAAPPSEEGQSAKALRLLMEKLAATAAEKETDKDAIQGNEPLLSYQLPAHPLNRAGNACGTLRGGNLSILYSLQNTPFACPVEDGDILFIEDVGEHPYAIDRMMQNLRLSGILSRLGGLIVGQFSDTEEDPRMPGTIYEEILRLAAPYSYPVVFNFPAGHVDTNMPLLMNAPCTMRVSESGSAEIASMHTA